VCHTAGEAAYEVLAGARAQLGGASFSPWQGLFFAEAGVGVGRKGNREM
jgi:hypothetical protein